MSKLTVLSFGGGQDSTALLYKYIHDKSFAHKYVRQDFIVVMADTNNEHEETNLHVSQTKALCEKMGIPFYFITGDQGYTSPVWSKGLVHFYESGNRIGSKAFPKTCTDKLKITPIYNFLEDYIHHVYGTSQVGRKRAIKEFAAEHGKIDVIIGIAAGEEKRASSNEESTSVWMRDCINKVYPLIDLKMDRQACQDYIASQGYIVPPPSNCILCPFMSYQELLYMYREMPVWYNKWVELEANKIKANSHVDPKKNMGVWGNKLLPEALKIAEEKHGHMTVAELKEYKMSHGHCVKSKY
jgi:3'-phosphoadenosine 5'-phosphosulfate sulfotransferase (PAPS reductase)/FAD synthetase